MAVGGSLSIVGLTSENSSVDVFTWPGTLQDPVVRVVSTGVEVWAYNTKAGATQLQGSYSYTRSDEYIGLSTTSGGTVSYEIGDEVAINTGGNSYSLYVVTLTKNDYFTCTDELKSVADAIRTKGNTSASLTYPNGFVTAINNLPTKVLGAGTFSGYDSPFDIQVTAEDYSGGNWDGFSSVTVNIETPFYDGSCDIIDPVRIIEFTAPVGTPDPEALRPGQLIWTQTTLQAEDGMTWGEWLESKYNTVGFVAHDIYYIAVDDGGANYVLSTTTAISQEACRLTDTIVADFDYVKRFY